MSGHSKWSNIKRKKERVDAKRGKVFTKLIREITVAARMGGGDPGDNPRLRLAVDKAIGQNMPRDTIERAIRRGAGDQEGADVKEIRYEGYGPLGVAVLVDCLTDNHNRTVAEVRHAFSKCGGNLGTDGSVAYLFTQQGILSFPPDSDEERIMEIALESGAEDVVTNDDGSIDVTTSYETFMAVKDAMESAGFKPEVAEIAMLPSTQVPLSGEDAEKVSRLIDLLEDLDDVQEVYTNADLDEDAASS